ncbi:cGMP-inhibited 3',5'-cyclic phosphodiesterase B [Kappamyces sp. JEL0829]|nr:cGMP-inhibited 3',5'-cyclic phosphodiesterase B [Kappamyces sp. JEL0829]
MGAQDKSRWIPRPSLFDGLGSSSLGSGLSGVEPRDRDAHLSLSTALSQHISETQKQIQCSAYSLAFLDYVDEDLYTSFMGNRVLKSWISLGCLAVCLLLALQIVMAFTLTPAVSSLEFYLIPLVYFPLVAIISVVYFNPSAFVIRNLQILTFFFILFAGPVFIIGRAWLMQNDFVAFVVSPIYITILYCSSYFLGLRFVYSVGIALLSVTTWFVLATLSWKYEMDRLAGELHNQSTANFIWSGISITIAMGVLCTIAYTMEWNSRLQFISNQKLIILNSKLQRQLKGLENTFSSRIADLESPLEKAIAGIKLLLASSHITGSQIRILHEILICLNSSHLMTPDLYNQVKNGGVVMDKEEEKWLFNELVRSQKSSRPFDDHGESSDPSSSALVHTAHVYPGSEMDIASTVSSRSNPSPQPSPKDLSDISALLTPETTALLAQVDNYNFPIFDFARETLNRPLVVMSHQLIVVSGLLKKLQLPEKKFMNFMVGVESGYKSSLSFHNSIHAADVLHGIYHLCQLEKIRGTFSDMELLSIYIAASIHDYDHPGVNNNFLIATRDKKALLYNDKSVLENHHCSAAFQVLIKPENNFLEGLDRKTYSSVRSSIVDMVLATDLAQHFDLLTRFKKKVVTAGTFDPFGNQDDRNILMQMLMKCADVSNPTKEWPIYQEWINRILTEFYCQGDLEKSVGLPVSPFMNRDSQGPSAQKGFIEFIVYPLFEALESWTPLRDLKVNLNASRDRFCGDPNAGSPVFASSSKETSPEAKRKNLRPLKLDFANQDGAPVMLKSASDYSPPLSARRASAGPRRSSVVNIIRSFTHSHSRTQSATSLPLARPLSMGIELSALAGLEDIQSSPEGGPEQPLEYKAPDESLNHNDT